MSRHSHWAKIKRDKGSADVARGNLFTRLSNAITIAVREGGGGDPNFNFRLRLTIDAAKSESMPKDNIDRAITKGLGTDGGATLEEIIYEGFAPGSVPLLITTVTDNRNRTAQEIKHILALHGGTFAGPGAVAWQFEKRGSLYLKLADNPKLKNRDETELTLIEAGADNLVWDSDGILVYTRPDQFKQIEHALTTAGFKINEARLEYVPKQKMTIDTATRAQVDELLATLEDTNDVQDLAIATDL